MGFSWDLADTMIKASIQFSKTHKKSILPGDLNRIPQNVILKNRSMDKKKPCKHDKLLLVSLHGLHGLIGNCELLSCLSDNQA
jgi:hypothetical protein